LGGEQDSIHDTEEIRDELLKVAFGVWDHIKNYGDHDAENWVLDWVGFLPGKRESRRYVGDHIMNQNDVEAEGRFDDLVAYGGWSMDDHHPGGMNYPGIPTIFHPSPCPFGIPYRSLYSKNIDNLYFAGRNISVTHAALSATRVMATCATLGQAVGTAAAIAVRDNLSPRGVYENSIKELQQMLMDDDSYLPWNKREVPEISRNAELTASEGNPEPIRNGLDRPIGSEDNGWTGSLQDSWIEYKFDKQSNINSMRFVFDSNLNRKIKNMHCSFPLDSKNHAVPESMIK
ncbi:MAG: FAD-dependent oxidoreductase, partial [Clostridiales bacterium]|nr:FAD-dependent oxidoreductase [Clostridiales bacterium]